MTHFFYFTFVRLPVL